MHYDLSLTSTDGKKREKTSDLNLIEVHEELQQRMHR